MTSQHSADEAGGEAIYCSDALPPLPVPLPPPPIIASHEQHSLGDILDSSPLPPNQVTVEAFGIVRYEKGVAVRESKLEKIERIRKELFDLDNSWRGEEEGNHGAGGGDEDVTKLRQQVEQLQQMFHDVLKRQYFSGGGGGTMKLSCTSSLGGKEDREQSAVQEHESVDNDVTVNTKGEQQQHDQRLLRIENILGVHGQNQNKSIMERLRIAEHKLSQIDDQKLARAASRAKVIRADLEAAAKARSKLNSSSNSGPDSAKISKLYNQLVAMDGFLSSDSNVLHAIVNRLEACADLHSKSMEFQRGLDSLESTVGDVKMWLSKLEESMGSLEKGMEDNMKIVQENMDTLDKRFV